MGLAKHKNKGVFCLEGAWQRSLRDRTSVEPVLRLLEDTHRIPYIHRDVGTPGELECYLRQWALKRYGDYPILVLAFHGSSDGLQLQGAGGKHTNMSLDQLQGLLQGRCAGRVLHLSSCSMLAGHGHRLNRFLKGTGALAVCGYIEEVDWITSAAFEVILFSRMQERAFTRSGMELVLRDVKEAAPGLARGLGFRMKVRLPNA